MRLQDFDYDLPPELIASRPLDQRSASRLLCLNRETGEIMHRQFADVVSLIHPNDLLIFNNSKVIPARLLGQKATGGRVEALVERILDDHRVLAQVRASKSPRAQTRLLFQGVEFEMINRQGELFELYCHDPRPVLEVIEQIGQIPIPPYFQRAPEELDRERYQTVYAKLKGSVAAPTAGLHFDEKILEALRSKKIAMGFVTLHVGAGTFSPVRVANIVEHRMHSEYVMVSEELCTQIRKTKQQGGRVIAVGTTTVRSLETASQEGEIKPFSGDTTIFIYPGYTFKCVDALITNFHLPRSTLLMLVAAFSGYENVMQAYREAVAEEYRFFSYGDAMWVSA